MSIVNQELYILKEENQKLKANFKKFLKKYETNKKFITKIKVHEFMEEQDTLINNINERIDNVIAKTDEENGPRPSKRIRKEEPVEKRYLENFINNPGLQHLAERIFVNLNYQDLKDCRLINKSSKIILENPMFWLKKFIQRGISKQDQTDWINAIHLTRDTNFKTNILWYLKRSFKNERVFNLPCYINEDNLREAADVISENKISFRSLISKMDGNLGVFQIAVPLIDDINYKCPGTKRTHIHMAIGDRNTKIIPVFAHLTENVNAPDINGMTPIHSAALFGVTEVLRFLAPLTDNPNVPEKHGVTPIHLAAMYDNTDIVRILAPLTDNPNVPNNDGETPIFLAAMFDNTEIVRIMAPLTDNPNAPNKYGITPMDLANTEVATILQSFL